MKKYLVLALLAFTGQAFAVLPPLYQGKNEIVAILETPEFGENLSSGDVLQEIVKTSSGYLIITNKRALAVVVHYQPSGVGPAQFTLEFKRPIELE